MALNLAGKQVDTIKIIDDDDDVRETLSWTVEDANLTPIEVPGPLDALNEFIQKSIEEADAAICDHKLTKGSYATFNGAMAVAGFYSKKFPALLCTAYSKVDIITIRKFREFIPILIESDKVNPDNIAEGLEACINELKGKFSQIRKSWETLIRVEDVFRDTISETFDVILPGWNSREIIRLQLDMIPHQYRDKIQPGFRFHAKVNKGAEDQSDLYFKDFEI